MEIFGVGPSELFFIVLIALIILGPKDMQKAGKTIGKFLRDIVTSDGWKIFQQTSREIQTLPNRLMREASDEMNQIGNEINNAVNIGTKRPDSLSTPARSQPMPTTPPENKITPPTAEPTTSEGDQNNNA